MVMGIHPVPRRPTISITVGQGPIALAVGAGGLDILLSSVLSSLTPSLWETARYRLKYSLKRPLNPKQSTNQMSKQTPPAPSVSAVGPCPTIIQTVGRSGTGTLFGRRPVIN